MLSTSFCLPQLATVGTRLNCGACFCCSLLCVIHFHVSWKFTDTRNVPQLFNYGVDMPPKPMRLPMYLDDLQSFLLCRFVPISCPFLLQVQIICQLMQMLRLGGGQQIEPVWELANRLSTLLATGRDRTLRCFKLSSKGTLEVWIISCLGCNSSY